MSNVKLTFNSEIINIFKDNNIPSQDGLSYLLNIYYGIRPSFIPEKLEAKILASKILSKDYSTGEFKWLVKLFEEQENGFEWITEWMDLFKNINPERRGVKQDVLRRMKKFFVNNPSVRKDDVFKATEDYLRTVGNPTYCKKSHKFIYEIDGSSMLLEYVEKINNKGNTKTFYDVI